MNKSGSTLVNIVLIIGLLTVFLIVSLSFNKIMFWQAKETETDIAGVITFQVADAIRRAISSPSDANFTVDLNFITPYNLNITNSRVSIYLPAQKIYAETSFFNPGIYVIESEIQSSAEVFVFKKGNTLYVTNKFTCDPSDNVCDAGCIFNEICDSQCYRRNVRDGVCNFYCIDNNGNSIIDLMDVDSKCDPDCYDAQQSGGIFDVDCLKDNDGICEPDTHNFIDNYCDNDCLGVNGVCDPDCTNSDADCPFWLDNYCDIIDRAENCLYSPHDCRCANTETCKFGCGAFTPYPGDFDEYGCVDTSLIGKPGDPCSSGLDCQCNTTAGLVCSPDLVGTNTYCCYDGTVFDGSNCVDRCGVAGCEASENCASCAADCGCVSPNTCCPAASATADGCAATVTLDPDPLITTNHGTPCLCQGQCVNGVCKNGFCCPQGYEWNGTECIIDCGYCTSVDHYYPCPNCDCSVNQGICPNPGDVCCPSDSSADPDTGCTPNTGIGNNVQCDCNAQCQSGNCKGAVNLGANVVCCPAGQVNTPAGCRNGVVYQVNEFSGTTAADFTTVIGSATSLFGGYYVVGPQSTSCLDSGMGYCRRRHSSRLSGCIRSRVDPGGDYNWCIIAYGDSTDCADGLVWSYSPIQQGIAYVDTTTTPTLGSLASSVC